MSLIVLSIGIAPVLAQTKPPASQTESATAAPKPQPVSADEESRLKQYLDKNGGYKGKDGGYYNPTAGTYTDDKGGIIDNWGGYTYKDGSYKTQFGDYYDAPARTFKLANGEALEAKDTSPADAIKALRTSVEQNGGYDKDFVRHAMMGRIKLEHPLVPAKAQHP